MNTRFFLGLGLAFALVLAAGIAAVVEVNHMNDRVAVSEVAPTAHTQPMPDTSSAGSAAESVSPPAPSAPSVVATFPPPPTPAVPVPVTVQPSDIANLANAVRLDAPTSGDVGKDVWMREVPVAQKLLQGMCDCDQRNWLNHFVSTGQEAISGSTQYPESVQLLAKLRRGTQYPVTSNP